MAAVSPSLSVRWPSCLFAVVCLGACGHTSPGPGRVVVLPLDSIGVPADRAAQMDRIIAREAHQGGAIAVVDAGETRRQVEQLEACREGPGREAVRCAAEAGKRLGSSHVVLGAVGRLGKTWLLRLKLLQVSTSTVDRTVEETLVGPTGELDRSLARATGRLFDLPRPRPWYTRWWVWTLVGAAVTAAVVVPVVLTRQEPDPYRDIPFP